MRRLFVSDAEVSALVNNLTARDHICWLRMFLWRVPRVLRYYRDAKFWKVKPWIGAKWLFYMLK